MSCYMATQTALVSKPNQPKETFVFSQEVVTAVVKPKKWYKRSEITNVRVPSESNLMRVLIKDRVSFFLPVSLDFSFRLLSFLKDLKPSSFSWEVLWISQDLHFPS
ncbi:hypothetical protein RclHR1_12700004 [Rhizophagus clarus]|uniref:Uncharacterized protein n=1 Tax=Rhizophagus clarus TaxID=94130 RepID=A0A2Z6R0X0_9GLOM|nr:hypothetical protein RclHR1_12700004 [Rhizophagus clarus]